MSTHNIFCDAENMKRNNHLNTIYTLNILTDKPVQAVWTQIELLPEDIEISYFL